MAGLARHTVVFAVRGPIARADLAGLSERICARLRDCGAELAICDVTEAHSDACTVDALARLHLAARRSGCRVKLRGASEELRALVAFMGLDEVLTD